MQSLSLTLSEIFDLSGYGALIFKGAQVTVQLAFFSLVLCFVLGIAGALAKLSSILWLRWVGGFYTTMVRCVPDLLLMLIVFYGLQTIVANIGHYLGIGYIDLDPFLTGVLTLGFIYGAYFAETFRGAIISVPSGQAEAAMAYGLSRSKVFALVIFPQMMRNSIPGLGNNWLVLLKATALVSIIGLSDLVEAAQSAGKSTFRMFFFLILCGLVYLLFTLLSGWLLNWLEKRYSAGFVRSAA